MGASLLHRALQKPSRPYNLFWECSLCLRDQDTVSNFQRAILAALLESRGVTFVPFELGKLSHSEAPPAWQSQGTWSMDGHREGHVAPFSPQEGSEQKFPKLPN